MNSHKSHSLVPLPFRDPFPRWLARRQPGSQPLLRLYYWYNRTWLSRGKPTCLVLFLTLPWLSHQFSWGPWLPPPILPSFYWVLSRGLRTSVSCEHQSLISLLQLKSLVFYFFFPFYSPIFPIILAISSNESIQLYYANTTSKVLKSVNWGWLRLDCQFS